MKSDDAAVAPASSPVVVVEDNLEQLEIDLGIPKQLRTEFNFLKFPFFDISEGTKRSKIEINESIVTNDGLFEILWRVTRNIESEFPGQFEKSVHRAVEQIINELPKPITNPVCLGTVYSFAKKRMKINPDSGKNCRSIERALKNIVKTTVEAKGTFQLKDSKTRKRRPIDDTFHLYERVVFRDEQLPDGTIADATYLWLGSWYLHNINSRYVVPLDWHFYNQLQGSITARMYEFLSIHFFAALEKGRDYYDVRYKVLCDYFPLTRYYPGWKARKQLKLAHDGLIRKGYFSQVEWLDAKESDDWLIRYWIGSRARQEYETNKSDIRQIADLAKSNSLPETHRHPQLPSGDNHNAALSDPNSPLESELTQIWGVTAKTAQTLLKSHPETRIREVIAWVRWAKAHKPKLVGQNPAGWIRKALEENWTKPPAGYVAEEELRAKQEKERQAVAEKDAAKAREYIEWYHQSPEERVKQYLEFWVTSREKLERRVFSKEEILAKEAELIKNEPTPEKKQIETFGKVRFPDML